MEKKRIIETKMYRLTDSGERLVSKDELERANSLKSFLQNPPTSQVYGGLPHPLQELLKTYDTAMERLYKAFAQFEQNPVLERFKEVEKSQKKFIESKVRAEKELYHQLTERELSRSVNDNKELEKEINRLKEQIKNNDEIVRLAFAVVENNKPQNLPTTIKKRVSVNTLNPNFDDPKTQINTIYEVTSPLFISNIEQWENLFSDNIKPFEKSIILKPTTTLNDLREFFNFLLANRLTLKLGLKDLETVKAFNYNGSTVTAKQLKDAGTAIKDKMYLQSNRIDNVLQSLECIKQ